MESGLLGKGRSAAHLGRMSLFTNNMMKKFDGSSLGKFARGGFGKLGSRLKRNRKRGAQVGRSIDPTKGGRYLRKSERDDLLRQRATREAEREERRRGKKSRSRDRLRDKGREWSRGRI